jgi:3-oxoacyl-[acyl-carrier protein] reductase
MVGIVTGGSKGIGLAVARAFLERGMQVTISARSAADLEKAAKALGGADSVHTIASDVRKPADAQRLVDETVRRFGGVDILVNNAGVGKFANVADMALEAWQQIIETNLSGVFYCTRAAIPEMKRRGGGFIINISSLAGKNSFTGGAAYCASKAGLNAFSEALMQEVRHDNIRVSYVMPGSVFTDFGDLGSSGEDWKLTAGDVAKVVTDLVSHDARSLPSRVELRPSRPRKS